MNSQTKQKLSLREKLGYGAGDLGNGLMFDLGQIYLLKFYTDVLGISAYTAGLVFLISKIFDAFADSAVGSFVDSRKYSSKLGKFRPFILFGSIPLAITTVLTFIAPDFSYTSKVVYAFATYMLFGFAYSVVNIPFGSLSSVMTNDPIERTKLASFRGLGYQLSIFITGIAVVPMITEFQNPKVGYPVAMAVMAFVGVIAHYLCYRNVKENLVVSSSLKEKKVPFMEILKSILTNRPMLILCLVSIFIISATFIKQAVQIFYAQYNLNNIHLIGILTSLSMGVTMLALFLTPLLTTRFGKKNTFLVGLSISIIAELLNFTLPVQSATFIVFYGISAFGLAIPNTLLWAHIADVIEYNEWKTGKRTEGIIYSSYSFFRKMAQALAGFLPGMVLGMIGYVPNAVQSAKTLTGLKGLFFLLPAVSFIVAALIFAFFYNLTDAKHKQILNELETRNNSN
ncbi:MFS transporter [Paenibacillus sp. LMG 31456]|uniref:MFS transporter n=1 Tax=Paenibacillus foliorum TaxID=2654974 RepID=A0A972GUZ5_9BACL|nr:glycoside-pentoside-hexuronide (GPH):cation symporter [Paenibacillus foliorum]NOU97376.1 MFS transporter [Paenibacillus foliorum]